MRNPDSKNSILESVGSAVTDYLSMTNPNGKCLAVLITRIREYPARYSLVLKLRE